MKSKNMQKKFNAPYICFCVFFVFLFILFIQFCYLGLSKKVYGIDMKKFASNRNTVTSVLTAERGTIYDSYGNTLAQNVSSYTLIAYLDPNRTVDENDPKHVVDKEYTATKLSQVLGEDNYEYILKRLNSNAKQVEFGRVGKNLTELTKLSIQELDLPGISFIETVKRYYPNGNFASYIVGYAKQYTRINIKVNESYDLYNYYKNYFNNYEGITIEYNNKDIITVENKTITGLQEGNSILFIKSYGSTLATIMVNVTNYDIYQTIDSAIVGELGIESNYEKKLQGTDGYIIYQQDKYGHKIPDTPEEKIEPQNGYDIYLTIDSNIQRFAENAITEIKEKYSPKWAIATVMDAKTGEILASATSPSFNPNSLDNDMSYQNPLVSYTYEPGSVMKIYTYMCAIETGLYDGKKEFLSGKYKFADGTIMHDWNNTGWGYTTYDNGFSYSSNIAVINIIKDYLSLGKLKKCLENYGFGKKTGAELSGEQAGSIDFLYETELMAAGFGQGISTTPIQQLQALTIVANDGTMIKPHIIKKIVNKQENIEIDTKIEKKKNIVSKNTVNKIKDLMDEVVSKQDATGTRYYIEGYDVIAKTGTAQIYENGGYLKGANDYIISAALMYPKDDPQIIIYMAAKQPTNTVHALPGPTIELIKNISKYKGMFEEVEEKEESNFYTLNTYINKKVSEVKLELEKNNLEVIVIGDGEKIIKQYPSKGTTVVKNDKIFLLTNGTNISMISLKGWSRLDTNKFCEFADITCEFDGYGYVEEQNIEKGKSLSSESKLAMKLGNIKNP